jgi:aryl-alcohol dehydrogenase-like predicted oxidoreductase
MFRALADTLLSGGVNVIDTCSLFRYGKSEKVINAVLNYLVKERGYSREEFLVSTKCGYIPNDIDSNLKETDFIKILTEDNIVKAE